MNYDFPNIEVADIEKKINLKQKAETDGRNNIPLSNAIVRSRTEEEAITEYDNIRHKAVDKAVEYLDPIKNKIIGYHAQLSQKHFFIDGFKERVKQTLNSAKGKLSKIMNAEEVTSGKLGILMGGAN